MTNNKWHRDTAVAIALQAGVSVLMEGPPGTGKTHFAKWLGGVMNRYFTRLDCTGLAPEDIRGYPRPCRMDDGTEYMEMIRPSYVYHVKGNAGKGGSLLLLDEINRSASHQAACHDIVQFFGTDHNCAIIGCYNPVGASSDGHEITPPLMNRCYRHIASSGSDVAASWCSAIKTDNWNEMGEVPILPADWKEKNLPFVRELVAMYIGLNPTALDCLPHDEAKRSQPWASQRSWTTLITLMAAAKSVNAGDKIEMELIRGTVGIEARDQFAQWLSAMDIPDVTKWFEDPQNFRIPKRQDVCLMATSRIMSLLQAAPQDVDLFIKTARVGIRLVQEVPELARGLQTYHAINKPEALPQKVGPVYGKDVARYLNVAICEHSDIVSDLVGKPDAWPNKYARVKREHAEGKAKHEAERAQRQQAEGGVATLTPPKKAKRTGPSGQAHRAGEAQ